MRCVEVVIDNDMLTSEHAEAEVFKLAASVVEEPRQEGGAGIVTDPPGGTVRACRGVSLRYRNSLHSAERS